MPGTRLSLSKTHYFPIVLVNTQEAVTPDMTENLLAGTLSHNQTKPKSAFSKNFGVTNSNENYWDVMPRDSVGRLSDLIMKDQGF